MIFYGFIHCQRKLASTAFNKNQHFKQISVKMVPKVDPNIQSYEFEG